ncbi:hypothetical protein M413DRAFT_33066, partial [Hebeloma cylindrosporum]
MSNFIYTQNDIHANVEFERSIPGEADWLTSLGQPPSINDSRPPSIDRFQARLSEGMDDPIHFELFLFTSKQMPTNSDPVTPMGPYSETLCSINSKAHLPLFQAFNHPLAPPSAKRTFVMYMDTTLEGMKECLAIERKLEIPFAHLKDLDAIGITTLGPNDALFAACTRINKDKRRPRLDVPKMDDLTKDQQDNLLAAQQELLGPREMRTNGAPTIDPLTNLRVGGAAIERTCRNSDKARSHTYGPSREKITKIVAPPASSKAFTSVAASGSQQGPPGTYEYLKLHTEIYNHLKIAENIEQMGSSGETHFDAFDFSGAFTSVISIPDLPDDMDPGCLFFLLAGICVRLDPYVTIHFSALHFHGGSPPIVPRGYQLQGWETRCNGVNYPQNLTLEGEARYPLVAAPDNKGVIFTTPEMRLPEKYADQLGQIDRATYGRDGLSLTNEYAYTDFISRETAIKVNYILSQVDERVSARLNLDMFMKSISFEIGGERRTARPWIYGPGYRPKGASNEIDQQGELTGPLESTAPLRKRAMDKLKAHREYLAQFIPHQVGNKKVDPLSESMIQELIEQDDKSDKAKNESDLSAFSVDARKKQGIRLLIVHRDAQDENDEENDTTLQEDNEKDVEQFQPDNEFDELVNTYGNTKAVREAEAKKAANEIAKERKRKRTKSQPSPEDDEQVALTSTPRKRRKSVHSPEEEEPVTSTSNSSKRRKSVHSHEEDEPVASTSNSSKRRKSIHSPEEEEPVASTSKSSKRSKSAHDPEDEEWVPSTSKHMKRTKSQCRPEDKELVASTTKPRMRSESRPSTEDEEELVASITTKKRKKYTGHSSSSVHHTKANSEES